MQLAGFESLLFLLVFILISGLSTWLQRKRQGAEESEWVPGEEPPHAPPRRPGTPPPSPAGQRRPVPGPLVEWEEELRRLLQGDRARPPQPPPEAVPPRLPSAPSQAAPVPRRREVVTARLEDSEQAYRRARQQQAEAAARLRAAQAKTARRRAGAETIRHAGRGDDIRAARALLSRPNLARRAVIASVILGQPKGLE